MAVGAGRTTFATSVRDTCALLDVTANSSSRHIQMLLAAILNFVVGATLISATLGADEEFRLLRDLRENYDIAERPVLNHSQPVNVKLRILLQQILNVVGQSRERESCEHRAR